MPTKNFYSCDIRSSSDVQSNSFRTMRREHNGKSYNVLMGRPKGKNKLVELTYNYPKSEWDSSEVSSHCKSHGGHVKKNNMPEIYQAAGINNNNNINDDTTNNDISHLSKDRRCVYCGKYADKRLVSKDGHSIAVDSRCLGKGISELEDEGIDSYHVIDMGYYHNDEKEEDEDKKQMRKTENLDQVYKFNHEIKKVDKEKHLVSGPFIEPDKEDLQGHVIDETEIREMVHSFAKNSLTMNYMHDPDQDEMVQGVSIVEIAVLYNDVDYYGTGEILKRGTGIITCEINNPELWDKIENGEISGFSIEGWAILEDVEEDNAKAA